MSTLEHPAVAKVAAALVAAGRPEAAEKIRVLPGEVRTAQLAADALGVDVGAIANSLVLEADGEPVLALTSGAHRANLEKIRAAVDAHKITMATPKFVKEHTGQVIGGVAPLGHPEKLITFVDTALHEHPVVWAAAGHAKSLFPTTFEDLLTVTQGRAIDVGDAKNRATGNRATESRVAQ
jgi:prolyl-tRNA editing enzyme YbaK/EbsC (Cys-tRNA(Pro) deacylase)